MTLNRKLCRRVYRRRIVKSSFVIEYKRYSN